MMRDAQYAPVKPGGRSLGAQSIATLVSDQESALAMGMIDYVYQPFPTGAQSTGSEVV